MDFIKIHRKNRNTKSNLTSFVDNAVCKRRRSINRKLRRKRSKLKYYNLLKYHRVNRNTEDLCDSISFVDIKEMEWTQSFSCNTDNLPTEIGEWQREHQLAYWKSRAISLEMENKMLLQHLRNVYAKQIQDYADYVEIEGADKHEEENPNETINESPRESQSTNKEIEKTANKEVVPKIPETGKRVTEMRQMYGNKADKIMGMETAVLLNYDRHKDQSQIKHWPNVPLKY